MTEFGKSIEEMGRMTLTQLACMASDKPPTEGRQIRSFAEYEAAIREEEDRWSADPS